MKYLILLIFIFLSCVQKIQTPPIVKKGILDARGWNFSNMGKMQLYGEWEFYYKQFIPFGNFENIAEQDKDFIQIPALWNTKEKNGEPLSNLSFATYRMKLIISDPSETYGLRIGDMYSAYELWVNGRLVANNGKPGKNYEEEIAEWHPVVSFLQLKEGENEFVLYISNYAHRKGGTWAHFELGLEKEISNYKHWLIAFDSFLIGSLLIMAVYHFGLFTLRKVDITSLLLGLFCIVSAMRIGVTGERFLVPILPFKSFETQLKIEYLTFFASFLLFYEFLIVLFLDKQKGWIIYFSYFISIASILLVLFTKATIYSHTAVPFQIFILLNSGYITWIMFKAIRNKIEGARPALVGIYILFSTFIIEIIYMNEIQIFAAVPPIFIFPFGVFLFLFFQSYLLSERFSKAFYSVERLSNDLLQTNEAISKFVPTPFLQQLNKNTVLDVKLGDQVQKNMSILFSDIREFTNLSETMSPKENFNFINSYLKRMGPFIQNNNGFIDKYIGDAIMALFPQNSEDALRAAIGMKQEIYHYNLERAKSNYNPISVGFGIHTGSLMLGIIGANDRMDGTVISDSVNLAARIEGLTKEYGVSIIVSESVIEEIESKNIYNYRLLDRVQVKGKTRKIIVYHVYDGEPENIQNVIHSIKSDFEEGVKNFHSQNYELALEKFRIVQTKYPDDKPTDIYINRCTEKFKS